MEPFPMNMIDFEDKRILVRPDTTDKGKGRDNHRQRKRS
jgi:hypothetical protein